MDCLRLPCIRVEEAVSWTQRFLTRKFWLKNRGHLWQKNLKGNVCRNSTFQVNRKKIDTGRRRLQYLEQPSRYFCQHFMRRTTQQTLLAINLASQQKTTKLYFSSQVRKQFKLLAVPFKPLRCCLRKTCELPCLKILQRSIFKLTRDWSVNQIVLLNGFLSDFVWDHFVCIY